jgi:hypothetical protein
LTAETFAFACLHISATVVLRNPFSINTALAAVSNFALVPPDFRCAINTPIKIQTVILNINLKQAFYFVKSKYNDSEKGEAFREERSAAPHLMPPTDGRSLQNAEEARLSELDKEII